MTSMKRRFESFLIFFILLQPFIDLLTTLSMRVINSSFTFGEIIRILVMLVGLIYLLSEKQFFQKRTIQYLVSLAILGVLLLLISHHYKPIFATGAEIKFLIKSAYFFVMLLCFIKAFQNMKDKNKGYDTVLKNIYYAMTTIGVVMIVSELTGTAIKSYSSMKLGSTGWFTSANELGAIVAMTFPLVVLYAYRNTRNLKNAYYWIPVLLLIYTLLVLGTKVAFLGGLLSLILITIAGILENRKDTTKSLTNANRLLLVITVLYILSTPLSPLMSNTKASIEHYLWKQEQIKNGQAPDNDPLKQYNEQELTNLTLSSRSAYLRMQEHYFIQAPIAQKVLGMGYAGNYTKQPKIVEMDFFDLFFSFGIVGFFILISPLIWALYQLIRYFFKLWPMTMKTDYIAGYIGIVLGLGISFTAGHVMFAPGVGIYLAVMIPLLLLRLKTLYSDKLQ